MTEKCKETLELYRQGIQKFCDTPDTWLDFLKSAAWTNRYDFRNQVLIYLQKPNARACAGFSIWRNRMQRPVKMGVHGIRILTSTERVEYVFDVSDTLETGNSAVLDLLGAVTQEQSGAVIAAICQQEEADISLDKAIRQAALKSAVQLCEKEIPTSQLPTVITFVADSVYACVAGRVLPDTAIFFRDMASKITQIAQLQLLEKSGAWIQKGSRQLIEQIAATVKAEQKKEMNLERSTQNDGYGNGTNNRGNHRLRTAGILRGETADVSDGVERGNVQGIAGEQRAFGISAFHTAQEQGNVQGAAGGEKEFTGNEEAAGKRSGEIQPIFGERQDKHSQHGDGRAGIHLKEETRKKAKTESEQKAGNGKKTADSAFFVPQKEENYEITDDFTGSGTSKERVRFNMEAVRLLTRLEKEKRPATDEEKKVLAGYSGWGGLSEVFEEKKSTYEVERTELLSLLTSEEYSSARSSVLNAHYTGNEIIRQMYHALEKMGFQSGNILEPSAGIGKFFGLLPKQFKESHLYGVELDSISGRIAKKLYPQAAISIGGFETTKQNNFYDLAIGNVPFGEYQVHDPEYNAYGFSIHNYFFAKALEQVRPGGIVAFITSRHTMDSKSKKAREYFAERATLLGAVRLPANAFSKTASTEVVSDILFLQKRTSPKKENVEWLESEVWQEDIRINRYFLKHPEMVLGKMETTSGAFGRTLTVLPNQDNLETAFSALIEKTFPEKIYEAESVSTDEEEIEAEKKGKKYLPASADIQNYSYGIVENTVYYRENSVMSEPVYTRGRTPEKLKAFIGLRDCLRDLLECQLTFISEEEFKEKQQHLHTLYDAYVKKYGFLNGSANAQALSGDSSYFLLCSVEKLDDEGNFKEKGDLFFKRTIRPSITVERVDTPVDALLESVRNKGCVDLSYMSTLLGVPGEYDTLKEALRGLIFKDPTYRMEEEEGWLSADEYLSGNVRRKLEEAKEAAKIDSQFQINVEALKKVQPVKIEAADISVRIGSTWIDKKYYQQFLEEAFQPQKWRNIKVNFSPATATWIVENKRNVFSGDILVRETYGTSRMNAFEILEATLNMKVVEVKDAVENTVTGKTSYVPNQKETALAQEKQQLLQEAFQNWIWEEKERRAELEETYNNLFNNRTLRSYDGSNLLFPGMNTEIELKEHQKNAVARTLYAGNTLLAHSVGAGKTFTMAASAMQAKRLGFCHKPLFVVPNHLTQQWAADFLKLYPGANVLVATKKDFQKQNRKKFCARIATGNFDAVIMGHTQFEKVPVSRERQERMVARQIEEILDEIAQTKAQKGENYTIRQLEKNRKQLEKKLAHLKESKGKDDVVTFEELGVDRLFVDESHYYKNLFVFTKMKNIAGISTSSANKSEDMFLKCRYLDEITGGKGVVFATGTPISNSITEMYTLMRYLQHERLKELGMSQFDAWASTFADTVSAMELAPEGTGFRLRTRLKFHNIPELTTLFREIADVKTAEELNLDVPKAEFKIVVTEPSQLQKKMMQELSVRADRIHKKLVDPREDNMLSITGDGRKIGLDQRMMNAQLPDEAGSKVNTCVDNVYRIWEEHTDTKATQLVFCDLSTPGKKKAAVLSKSGENSLKRIPEQFENVYDDMKRKLIKRGIPEEEIAFIHDAASDVQKEKLFEKVRSGKVRVLFGSTAKIGAGTNVQKKLIALHHLDCGWKPSDMEQRNGRIIRNGNENQKVTIYSYVTDGTFDAYMYQTLENKQKFISQIITNKSPLRVSEDVDTMELSYAETKACCAGDPRLKKKMELDTEVAKLTMQKNGYLSAKHRMEDQIAYYFPIEIQKCKTNIENLQRDIRLYEKAPKEAEESVCIELLGTFYTEKTDAAKALLEACGSISVEEKKQIGSYKGFELLLSFDVLSSRFQLILRGNMSHELRFSTVTGRIFSHMEEILINLPSELERQKELYINLEKGLEQAKEAIIKPFEREEELQEKKLLLLQLTRELSLDETAENPEAENPEAGNLEAENPEAENPEAENPEAGNLNIEKLETEELKTGEPTVTVIYSESNQLYEGKILSLFYADRLFASLDKEKGELAGYDKTKFRIDFVRNGEADSYEGRQDFGDGDGGLIEHIEQYHTYYVENPDWENYILQHGGREALEADREQRKLLLHEFVPYLKLHRNLSEMEQELNTAMRSGKKVTQTEAAYHTALQKYISDCRNMLNQGSCELPPAPRLADFDTELQEYKQHVSEEIAQEAKRAGMTVEEYAANDYEPCTSLPGTLLPRL